ncbi:MAG: phosphotriesterase-related protein [Gordonia sp. (in: high G+C Gram-positive bacteria)]|uniref:phosphotriesterase family protein n=1 Tax=Gordonia sp. (in: high G+C Gram-positive bacteria) TaxID=84139 RepID=UPI0039E2F777
METINTATGTIRPGALGSVLTHEHVFVLNEDYRLNFLPDWDEEAQVAGAVERLDQLAGLGIDTLVDVSVPGMGRNVARVRRVAEQVDLNILVATGFFTYNDLPLQLHYTGPGLGYDSPEPLAEAFVRDLTEGIPNSGGVRAAVLVCVIEAEGLTPGVERIMRAVGQAGAATGAPVVVHTNPHTRSGLVAQRILAEEGIDLRRVMLAHSGDTGDLDHLRQLADAGSILGLDRFGVDVLLPHDTRMATLQALLDAGYADRITLSQSAFCYSDWFDPVKQRRVAPNWNYRQISERVIPELRRAGVSEQVVDTMMVDVPRRFLAGAVAEPGLPASFSIISGLSPEN